MSGVHLHLLHGFLGEPEDWQGVCEFLDPGLKVISHDLNSIPLPSPGDENPFSKWANQFAERYLLGGVKKVVVGYSLGGRLALHLPDAAFDHLILLAAHPGLLQGHESRQKADQDWFDKAQTLSQSEWYSRWNQQEVFQQDKKRPQRVDSDEIWQKKIALLPVFSLSGQSLRDDFIRDNQSKIHWAFGETDHKFSQLQERFSRLLPKAHIHQVPNAGHGVLFENPQAVAQLIQQVIENDC